MNIFALSKNPWEAAKWHCDRHICKMIVEYAQLLSTAHRVLDGFPCIPIGKRSFGSLLTLEGEEVTVIENKLTIMNPKCYGATHINHPCSKWVRTNDANYHWLMQLLEACLVEYTSRYNKIHRVQDLVSFLRTAPKAIAHGQLTPFALAMPECYKVLEDEILSYQSYYVGEKVRFARWTNTEPPSWFIYRTRKDHDPSSFKRTRSLVKGQNRST